MGNFFYCCKFQKDENELIFQRNIKEIKSSLEKTQSFDKNKCRKITSNLPKRENTNLNSFKNIIKSNTYNQSDIEKAYILFIWECNNIDYDVKSYFSGKNCDCSPEFVFKNGKTVCSGYSHLYKDIAMYLDLKVECVSCFEKGVSYKPGDNDKNKS